MAEKDIGPLVVVRGTDVRQGTDLVGLISERDYERKAFVKSHSSKQ